YLRFNNTEFKTGKDIDSQTFHDKVKKFKRDPTSSAPSPNDFYEALKTTDPTKPVLMISLSTALSSTYDNAITDKNQILREETSREIAVINTKSASCGTALIIHEAKRKNERRLLF